MAKFKFFLPYVTFMLILLFLGGFSSEESSFQPQVKEGSLDLTEWVSNGNPFQLNGEWEFYWEQLLEPEDFKNSIVGGKDTIFVPSSWNKYEVNQKEVSSDGYATYRLTFTMEEEERLALRIPRIFTAYKLWINDELLASAGVVGTERESMTPQYLPQIAFFESRSGENEIVIQVSNFFHRSGGILEAIIIGEEKEVLHFGKESIAYELYLFGSLTIIGIYHLALFMFRRKDKAPLYFGLFCLLVGVRTLLVGERFFIQQFPDFSWELAHKIQTLAYYLGVPLVVAFFKSVFFLQKVYTKVAQVVWGTALVFAVIVITTPAAIFTIFNPGFQIFSFTVMLFLLVTLIRVLLEKRKGALLLVIGGVALIFTSFCDMIFLSIWKNDNGFIGIGSLFGAGSMSSIGQLIFALANSFVLARNFSITLEKEEVMTKQLKETNLHLDELVLKRTEALERSKRKIEEQKLQLEEANKTLRLISLKDPLTDLWNRRYFDEMIQKEWYRNLRNHQPIAVLLLDIDHFKNYNDSYGHNEGDACLKKLAQTIEGCTQRAGDIAARYGGEEFVIVLPDLDKEEALFMAEKLRKRVEELNIPHKSSPISDHVTVCIGVTSAIPRRNGTPKDLLLAADRALYQAKGEGKNKVQFMASYEEE